MKKSNTVTLAALQKRLSEIPKGMVTTYAELARALGVPKAPRAVGTLCGKNTEVNTYPCFKVVRSNGEIGQYALGQKDKIRRLVEEGIEIKNGKIINLERKIFRFS